MVKKNYNDMYGKEKIKETPPPVEEKTAPIPIVVVTGCAKLNLRREPSVASDVICILNLSDEVVVNSVTEDWANVTTSTGAEGYVMRSFIKEV